MITRSSPPRSYTSFISNWSKSKPFVQPVRADDKAEFLGLGAYLMKRLLIHHARPLSKRAEKAELPDLPGPHSHTEHSLLETDDVLNCLAASIPRSTG